MQWAFLLTVLLSTSCAYRFGSAERSLPGGYDSVAIPVFVNKTPETGIEVYFTNALIQEFRRSKVARIVDKNDSQAILLGTIDDVSDAAAATTTAQLPADTSLTTAYRRTVQLTIQLVRSSDRKLIWSGSFRGEANYQAAQITQPVLNTVNPLYNQSARDYNVSLMAKDLMTEAHDRITENF